jgi:hypothetical protein
MDISRNIIDLMYLTNQTNMDKISKIRTEKTISKKNLEKYKDKFLTLTTDILNGKKIKNETDNITQDMKYEFHEYFKKAMGYFDFLEKKKIIQARYKDMQKKTSKIKNMNIDELDISIMKKPKKVKHKDLTGFVKKKKTKNKKKIVMPKQLKSSSTKIVVPK